MASLLEASTRGDSANSGLNKLRNEGKIPAVVYGNDTDSQPITVEYVDFIKTYREAGKNGIISLNVEGGKRNVMVQDMQIDRLKDKVIHLDFLEVKMDEEVESEVPVHLVGEAAGSKEGGVLQQPLTYVNVKALPAKLPREIELNVENLHIGDSIMVNELSSSSSYEILNGPEEVIVSITKASTEKENLQDPDVEEEASEEVGEDDSTE